MCHSVNVMENRSEGSTVPEWQKKNEKMKKIQFLREIEKIKLQKHTTERERIGFMYEKRDKQYSHLEEIEKSLNHELKTERMKLEQQLKKMKSKVCEFQKELKNVKATPEFVQKLKTTMEDIESTIGDFKQKQRDIFESLMISEKETEQELNILESKINAMKDSNPPVSARSGKVRVKANQHNLPKEIQQFELYVAQHGGLQGGWDDYDHGAFLRIREKFKRNKNFISAAARQIPGRSECDLEEHEKWFSHFIELKNNKKEAIDLWKRRKEEKENLDVNIEENEETRKIREEQEEMKRKKCEAERQMKKEELKSWKEQKREKQFHEEELKELERMQKDAVEFRKRKEREAASQLTRQKLKEKKEQEERLKWMKELETEQLEMERQRDVRQKIAQFQSRDHVALNLKQRERKMKEDIEIAKKEKLHETKYKVQVARDPSRLYQLTEGWVNRTRDNGESKLQNAGVIKMPHRAVPTWRQNM